MSEQPFQALQSSAEAPAGVSNAGQKSGQAKGGDAHDHDGAKISPLTLFSLASNALLLVLLVVAMRRAQMERKPEGVQP